MSRGKSIRRSMRRSKIWSKSHSKSWIRGESRTLRKVTVEIKPPQVLKIFFKNPVGARITPDGLNPSSLKNTKARVPDGGNAASAHEGAGSSRVGPASRQCARLIS